MTTVALATTAARDIVAEAPRSVDGRETGGWLFGRRTASTRVLILGACGPGPSSRRGLGFVTRSLGHGERRAQGRGLDLVGSWHTHPDGATNLSDTDVATATEDFGSLRDEHGDDWAYIEIIATRGHDGWHAPRLTAYVFTPSANTVRCEHAEVQR